MSTAQRKRPEEGRLEVLPWGYRGEQCCASYVYSHEDNFPAGSCETSRDFDAENAVRTVLFTAKLLHGNEVFYT
jgi:hypothetical protein